MRTAIFAAMIAAALHGQVQAQTITDEQLTQIAQAKAKMLEFYPAQAKAAGVAGSATLSCKMSPHGALRVCTVVSESPAGSGFGEAAMRIAAASMEWPSISLTTDQMAQSRSINLTFKPSPGAIEPNLLVPFKYIEDPRWTRMPTGEGFANLYPEWAASYNLSGQTVSACLVTAAGKLDDCQVISERPTGAGFGGAAIKVLHLFRMGPLNSLGLPVDGSLVIMPVNFQKLR